MTVTEILTELKLIHETCKSMQSDYYDSMDYTSGMESARDLIGDEIAYLIERIEKAQNGTDGPTDSCRRNNDVPRSTKSS